MQFEKIKGHGEIVSKFRKNLEEDKFQGSYLFTGPVSVGKYTIARQLAKYLLCTGVKDDTCRCESCRIFPASPDYLQIAEGDKTITVSVIEELESFLSLVPYRSSYRVVVIDNADNLNTSTTNRLLKLIEDYHSSNIVILVSSQPEKLSPILTSRLYSEEFGPLVSEDMSDILKDQGHPQGDLEKFKKCLPFFTQDIFRNFSIYSAHIRTTPKFLKDFKSIGEDDLLIFLKDLDTKNELVIFTEVLIVYLTDILKIRYESPDVVSVIKELDTLEVLTEFWKEDLCIGFIERLRAALFEINKTLNLKPLQYLTPVFLWMYYFFRKSINDKTNQKAS